VALPVQCQTRAVATWHRLSRGCALERHDLLASAGGGALEPTRPAARAWWSRKRIGSIYAKHVRETLLRARLRLVEQGTWHAARRFTATHASPTPSDGSGRFGGVLPLRARPRIAWARQPSGKICHSLPEQTKITRRNEPPQQDLPVHRLERWRQPTCLFCQNDVTMACAQCPVGGDRLKQLLSITRRHARAEHDNKRVRVVSQQRQCA